MIVVSPDAMPAMLARPVDAGLWLQRIVHQVAQTQAQVVRFLDSLKCRPVAVNVRQQKDTHEFPGRKRVWPTAIFTAENKHHNIEGQYPGRSCWTIGVPRGLYGARPIIPPHDVAAIVDLVREMFPRLAGTVEGHAGAARRRVSRFEPACPPPQPLSDPEIHAQCAIAPARGGKRSDGHGRVSSGTAQTHSRPSAP